MQTRAFLLLPLLLLSLTWGCELTPHDDILDGKACDSRGACASGYACDPRYNVCRKVGAGGQAGQTGEQPDAEVPAMAGSGGTTAASHD